MTQKVEFYRHSVGEAERASVDAALRDPFLTTGARVREFEAKFGGMFADDAQVLGLSSCTAALHLSLLAFGVGPGDEVITTPLTFIATANVILHAGATPVFVDVDPGTGLIDPELVEAAITARTKAVIAVHLYGQMADVRALRAICEPRGIKLIEDAAHAVESLRDSVQPGDVGDCACFSFYATKNLTSGEGGALLSRDREFLERARTLSNHGMSKNAADRYGGSYVHWDMVALGYKYNMTNIQAAMLLPQLPHVEDKCARRQAIACQYKAGFQLLPFVQFPAVAGGEGSRNARHLFVVFVSDMRDEVLSALGNEGVGVAVNYRAVHRLTFWKERLGLASDALPHATDLGERCISLPMYPDLTDREVQYVVETVAAVGGRLGLS